MPRRRGPVRIASVLGDDRDSLARHTFLGGNAFMLRLMNRFRAELGVQATPAELEATARATIRQLETRHRDPARSTAPTSTAARSRSTSLVTNLTGHKFPTGYPSRRAWLHVTVRDAAGSAVFESGACHGHRARSRATTAMPTARAFEPHYAEITRPDQVQIYESIMGTPAGTADDRPPAGDAVPEGQPAAAARLRQAHAPTAEIAVVGEAARDPDFAGGSDRVRYRVPVPGAGALTVDVELRYQPIGFRWAQQPRGLRRAGAAAFVGYFDALARFSTVLVARAVRAIDPLRAEVPHPFQSSFTPSSAGRTRQ